MGNHQVLNPATGNLLYQYEYTDIQDSLDAISKLVTTGKEQQVNLSPRDRFTILMKLKDLIESHTESLALQITQETGKIITEARGEVQRALITLEVSAEEAKRIKGEAQKAGNFTEYHHKISITQKHPLGVIFCITPFNFPLNLALHKIAPAFASGNTILFKPSECNYKLGQELVRLCLAAGFPTDTIKMISPNIENLNTIVSQESIACISFTGGTRTADKIAKLAGRKKLLFELGGNDALVIFNAEDIERGVSEAIAGRFGTCGQKCTASKRIFVHKSIYEQFKTELLKQASKYETSFCQNPEDKNSILGPLISEAAAKNVYALVQAAVDDGASILQGHQREGAFYSATIIENVRNDNELLYEETFGPVLPLIKFGTEEELISLINATPYGLQAGIFTKDIDQAKRLFQKLEVGTVIINGNNGYRQEDLPFGGVKNSGFGREGIKYAINELTYIKQLII